jgi:hypothetical protein
MRELFFASATRAAKEDTPLWFSLQALGIRECHFFEHNQRGLPECYNEVLDRMAGSERILVLSHADVTLSDVFVRQKLNQALTVFDIVGLVGSSYFDVHKPTDHYAWEVWPIEHLSGAVEHGVGPGLTRWATFGAVPRQCIILDGVFLAIDLRSIGSVRFDPHFPFHLYDLDFCLAAHFAGLKMGTTNVYIQHSSRGHFTTDAYQGAMQEFRAKWKGPIPQPPAPGA